jgi:deazaflavin-dependent oxidoreductase (nitroreductase family)
MCWQKLYNPIVSWLLRSSLHGLMSNSTMLITFAGRKSGKIYTTPVNYVRDDQTLLVVSPTDRLWWRNLRGGAPVTVRVRGQTLQGVGRAFEDEEAVEKGGFLTVLRKVPAYRRYWGVKFDENGQPNDRDLLRVAHTNALVRIGDLSPTQGGLEAGIEMREKAEQDSTRGVGLWLRWVLANSFAETVGLGAAFGIGAILFPYLSAPGILTALATVAVAVLAGTLIEGTVVGSAQWLVLRRPLPGMRWRAWVLATAAGAFIAWTSGMLPTTLLSAGSDESGGSTPSEPSEAMVYALAALMGLVAGTILGTPQWLVLRRHVRRAAWWIGANALAWVPGMILAFVAADFIFSAGSGVATVVLAIVTLAAIGGIVGAIHGLVLIWLVQPRRARG